MFYLAGLAYLLFGIIVGSGIWFGWGQALGMANPTEVHIHTNIWGFMSLVLNLRQLEAHNIRLKGQVPAAELGIDSLDECPVGPNPGAPT